ncbi:MAG: NUDIX hydrolase N-terminal domain-containing protein [Acidimicrobiia bacterium]|nr:NUDIX hydrolase N-terminal domain-containing protein [Acidimicrobiia bacterium]MDH4306516.1 NUDIX hydrolase N-terminal domain-containing protein [Acidimicrobiia bacterium]
MTSPLLDWIWRLQAIAQSGLTYAPGEYDRQRYEQIRALAAEMATHPGGDVESVRSVFSSMTGYATPLIICRAAVFDGEDRILMVRETADGRWTLPGGWIDVGDSPSGATEREVLEETGYRVSVSKLAAVFDKRKHAHPPAPHHAYLMFFIAHLQGGSPATSIETSEIGWFGADELPELSTGRATRPQIMRMWDHHRDPALATDFD